MSHGLCFRCCGPKKHRAKECTNNIRCDDVCNGSHSAALHEDNRRHEGEKGKGSTIHENEARVEMVLSTCTHVCGTIQGTSKSCAKIVPARIYHDSLKQHSRTVYVLIDDQSSHSLASPSLFDAFNQDYPNHQYTLISCSGSFAASGRRGIGFVIESLNGKCSFKLPMLIECAELPNNREEIPSPRVAKGYSHLADISDKIPDLLENVEIEVLIGRDLIDAHVVQDQRKGSRGMPFAQSLTLGWVIIGPVCLDSLHIPEKINVNKTHIIQNGRPSLLHPCDNRIQIKDHIFIKTENDETMALSIEDEKFMELMDKDFKENADGQWEAPLSFRTQRPPLPNNKLQAINRGAALDRSLRRNPTKKEHVSTFMDKIFEKGHAEKAPPLPDSKKRWYLPMFGVYHPQKKDSEWCSTPLQSLTTYRSMMFCLKDLTSLTT